MLEDVVRGEMAERELDAFIERRALKMNPKQQRIEDGWAESVRKYNARDREQCLRERAAYHQVMLETHTRTFEELLKRHRAGLRLCEEALGIESQGGNAA